MIGRQEDSPRHWFLDEKNIPLDFYFQEAILVFEQKEGEFYSNTNQEDSSISFSLHDISNDIHENLDIISAILDNTSKQVPILDEVAFQRSRSALCTIANIAAMDVLPQKILSLFKILLMQRYEKFTGIPISVSNGDALRNVNSYEYLRNFSVINLEEYDCQEETIRTVFDIIKNKYNPYYPYGDLYTQFYTDMEKMTDGDPFLVEKITHYIYFNHNLATQRSYKTVQGILRSINQTSSQCEEAIRKQLEVSPQNQINQVTGRHLDQMLTKLQDKIVPIAVRPQAISSLPSIRRLAYQTQKPLEIRMGTQGVFTDATPGINPHFIAWLVSKKALNPLSRHVYFNLLPIDRPNPADSVMTANFWSFPKRNAYSEVLLAKQLHQELDEEAYNIAMITLPSSQGLLDPKLARSTINMTIEYANKQMLDILCGRSSLPIQDFVLSPIVKKWLYEDCSLQEDVCMQMLLDNSFAIFGFNPEDTLSGKDQQMIYFHLMKYEIPRFILDTLNPESFNFSCWDGMDRGGIASAYFNLMRSLQTNKPLSLMEFECILHGAPVMVRERGMNNQSHLLWSVLAFHLQRQKQLGRSILPDWVSTWCEANALRGAVAEMEDSFSMLSSETEDKIHQQFLITQQSCITNFILKNAPNVVLSQEQNTLNLSFPTNDLSENVGKQPQLTQIALETGLREKAWKAKDSVNQFYHNALVHFIFIYLDPNIPILSQLDDIIQKILLDKIEKVLTQLHLAKQTLIRHLDVSSEMVVVNPANPHNLGGAVAYDRGTVEEALCRKSDLFLDILLFQASGAYQKEILKKLMLVFKKMLITGTLPIQTKAESAAHTEIWVTLVYKTSSVGYHIKPHEIHEHPAIFFIDNEKLPTLSDLQNARPNLQQVFFNDCRLATVIDVVATDHRLQTKLLKFLQIQEQEPIAGFDDIMQAIATVMSTKKQHTTLVIVPVGCGAFGNKLEDFCSSLEKNLPLLTQYAPVSLVIQKHDILKITKLFNFLSSSNENLVYDTPFKTMETLWKTFYERITSANFSAGTVQELEAIVHVFSKQRRSIPPEEIQRFCREELIRNTLPSKTTGELKLQILYKFCNALLGESFAMYLSLNNTLTRAIDTYDKHTGWHGFMTNKIQGENIHLIKLRKFFLELYQDPALTYQAHYVKFKELRCILDEKERLCPKRTPGSLLDKSFEIVRTNLDAMEQQLRTVALDEDCSADLKETPRGM